MSVSNVVFFPSKHKTIKANGYFTLDEKYKVKFMLMLGPTGLFVSYPSEAYEKKQEDGSTKKMYAKYFEPMGKELSNQIGQEVLKEWAKKNGNSYQNDTQEPSSQVDNSSLVPF